jgi:hypothetical protein
MVKILKNTGIYELEQFIDADKKDLRCLNLNFQLNLTEEIRIYNTI